MIEISNVSKKIKDQLVLDNINLLIKDDENVLFTGQNGAGKSSLMRVILGEYVASSGFVKINGFNAFKDRQNALKNVSFVPQTPPPFKLNLSEMIWFAKQSSNANLSIINEICGELNFNINENLHKPFFKLSGGMKQKFLIALAFSRPAKTMIFDEPTANLDPEARLKFKEILTNYKNKKSFIFISHRLDEVAGLINRAINMDLGRVVDDKRV
ncbi:ATP-binding cassette domain-containing protein [Campylobacter gastrosuis]|uniref:ABC transporter ATP-binding protein n=1 Tax=Campylobacter gastrosuis TaxID=2974576 RepID=A0ABT7HRX8_9BACT|nr:ABC transporter ATP-binding protein [Campylobacter gastrosuis]MDL0089492.1 ABC transporter ATP-binding protein [Campylobacter gastrosuis]